MSAAQKKKDKKKKKRAEGKAAEAKVAEQTAPAPLGSAPESPGELFPWESQEDLDSFFTSLAAAPSTAPQSAGAEVEVEVNEEADLVSMMNAMNGKVPAYPEK
jgi:hypothetical protein